MISYLIYLLQVSFVFASLVSFYYLFLKDLTFHTFNRIILILIIPTSLVIPVIEMPENVITSNYIYEISSFDTSIDNVSTTFEEPKALAANICIAYYLGIFYYLGVGVSLTLLCLNIFKILHIKRLSEKEERAGVIIYTSSNPVVFSCFHWIFVPKAMPLKLLSLILKHEQAHVRKNHTFDLLFVELFAALLWFNPFIYLFRNLLKAVHEYQADTYVLQQDISKSTYLTLLLQNLSHTNGYGITSNFKSSQIKKRVKMMTKNKSKRIQSMKYLFILPITLGLLMAFAPFPVEEPSIFPIAEGLYDKISSPFGVTRKNPFSKEIEKHNGIDIVAKSGTPVLATGDGKVIKAEYNKAYGHMIVIDHGDNIQTMYAHLHKVNVKEGELVKLKDVIGEVGNTGRSTAPHLHYEVRKGKKHIDPSLYFKE